VREKVMEKLRTEEGLHPNPPPFTEVFTAEGTRVPSSVAISGHGGGPGRGSR
jgi:hypothetical protein